MSVQYRAATSSATSSKVDLPDAVIPAGGIYLVGGATPASPTTAATISPDASNNSMNLSGTAGGIAPVGDLTTGDYPCALGIATSTTVLNVKIQSGGAAL